MGGTLTLSTLRSDRLALRFSLCRLGSGSYEQRRQVGARGINFLVPTIYESTAADVLRKIQAAQGKLLLLVHIARLGWASLGNVATLPPRVARLNPEFCAGGGVSSVLIT